MKLNRRIWWLLVLVLAGPGCGQVRWNLLKQQDNTPAPKELPTVAGLVSYLNDNADRVQSLTCKDIDVTCTMGLQPIGLRARMDAQKPRDFRMKGFAVGSEMVDVGSNNQEFWWWIAKSDPYQFYCSYKDFHEGRVKGMGLPFQPEWIMETMGLGPYGPPEKYTMEHDADTVRLIEKTRTPDGKPVRKVIVFNRRPVQPPRAQVSEYALIDDASGKEIYSAHIIETQLEKKTNAFLPRRIEFRWPKERLKLALRLDGMTANTSPAAQIFVRPTLAGVQSFNLAVGRPDGPLQASGDGQ